MNPSDAVVSGRGIPEEIKAHTNVSACWIRCHVPVGPAETRMPGFAHVGVHATDGMRKLLRGRPRGGRVGSGGGCMRGMGEGGPEASPGE